mmetsp:Transcript_7218/g.14912  ORF Transcript_7218/g.14912 Transcript_7218/m.14912 type:complete len:210 (+) Transcript_7218:604-1233(+)
MEHSCAVFPPGALHKSTTYMSSGCLSPLSLLKLLNNAIAGSIALTSCTHHAPSSYRGHFDTAPPKSSGIRMDPTGSNSAGCALPSSSVVVNKSRICSNLSIVRSSRDLSSCGISPSIGSCAFEWLTVINTGDWDMAASTNVCVVSLPYCWTNCFASHGSRLSMIDVASNLDLPSLSIFLSTALTKLICAFDTLIFGCIRNDSTVSETAA